MPDRTLQSTARRSPSSGVATPSNLFGATDISEAMKSRLVRRALSEINPIEPYEADKMGKLQVFFLPDDQIKVWVYPAGPQNPGHPSHMGYPEPPASAASSPASPKESTHGR